MTKNGNALRMHKLVKEFRGFGRSQKEFAAAHGLSEGKMHYWVSKTARAERPAPPSIVAKKDFVAISVTPESEDRNIVIRLKSGVEIEIPV
ncbi:hypothetical protein SAMN05421636_11099 [Pricia antarctica]|uniref:Transposase n=1 Tax=Pricia antarctica TaxID=641691 RepID=A0A1G7HYL9_9FLAO|nr:hypothetical protein [Pricia antarctica]SDF05550.1 hypothetical protein SAMN05421636_11099 [Pricia antarctica]